MKLMLTLYYGGCRGYQKLLTFWTRRLTNVMQILISLHADINIIIKEGMSYNNVPKTNSSNHSIPHAFPTATMD